MKGTAQRAAGAVAATLCVLGLFGGGVASAAEPEAPSISGPTASAVSGTSATLKGTINPNGLEVKSWRFAFGTSDCAVKPNPCKFTAREKIPAGLAPVLVSKTITGLTPGTIYHFLLEAENSAGPKVSTDRAFATQGTPSTGLPDNRAYEQSTPTNKDGGDADGELGLPKAADNGNGISFASNFGLPGGKGAQALPTFVAARGEGEAGWATQGLLPPPLFGERAQVQGWLPDFSKTYAKVEKLGNPRTKAMVEQSTTGGPPTIIAPYTKTKGEISYAGASADDSVVIFEAEAQLQTKETGGTLITGAAAGRPNVYAWSRATGEVSLAGEMNDENAPSKGTIAGPYNWSKGINPEALRTGGSTLGYYLQGPHAISESGDVYFTEAGTGQLYLRLNPTQPQSAMAGEECLDPTKACTIHVSASQRTIPDTAGPQPAAFQAASGDGSEVFFTSPEKLTDESNTGPAQPVASIQLGSNSAPDTIENPALVKKHAIGVAVDGSHLYWANPASGTIEWSNPSGGELKEASIPSGECEVEEEVGEGEFEVKKVQIPSTPNYVAVNEAAKFIYWTNGGLRDNEGVPIDGGGTIGRAELDGAGDVVNPEAAFICGEFEPSPSVRKAAVSNPQGIGVDAGHIYWANAGKDDFKHSIARADIGGGGVEAEFVVAPTFPPTRIPYGVAVDGGHIYFALEAPGQNLGFVERVTLEGTEPFGFFVGETGVRGLALDGTNLYWATQGEEAIGRVPISDLKLGGCPAVPTCEAEFIKLTGKPSGLAAASGHLYWSINGEAASNPGNDLYRFEAGSGTLKDLTYDPADVSGGAEVQGVLGASADGSYLYFAANGDLDGPGVGATKGNCETPQPHGSIGQTSGACNVYLLHEGAISFVGRVKGTDATDWTGTPIEVFAHFTPKSAFVSKDGQTLLFGSREKLSAYENEGVPELYRFHAGDGALSCVSCPATGEGPGKGPTLGSVHFPGAITPLLFGVAMLESRNLSADGKRAFFESTEALVSGDTNGQVSCPSMGVTPACQDVYEWEAPGAGSCTTAGPAYSPLNEGCLYLISSGKSPYPSFFADASENGNDAFFFTRQSLVGQDEDELQDVYDARVGGGLASQNQVTPQLCEGSEACHGLYPAPPAEGSAASAGFVGPSDPKPKHKKAAKGTKHKAKGKGKKQGKKGKAKSKRRVER